MRTFWVTLYLLALMFLASCGKKLPPEIVTVYTPVEVKIPVAVKAHPPAELLAAKPIPLPIFVAPADPLASSALTAEGERLLRGLIEELLQRIESWRAWAVAP